MIQVTLSDGLLSITGHSDPVICAGVSTLSATLYWSLKDLTCSYVSEEDDGTEYRLFFYSLDDKGQLLLDSFRTGLNLIASNYQGKIQIHDQTGSQ